MGYIINRGTEARPNLYCCFVDIDGKWKRRPARTPSKVEARRILEDYEERVKQGLPGSPPRDRGAALEAQRERIAKRAQKGSVTVEQLARRFLGEVDGDPGYAPPRIKNLKRYRRDARSVFAVRLLPSLQAKPAAEVTSHDVELLRDKLLKGSAPESVIHALGALSKLYNWGARVGLIDCPNPVRGVERPRTVHSLDYLSAEEVARLLERVEDLAQLGVASWASLTLGPMVATAIYTGLRRGELAGLRWQDVSFDASRIDVMRSYYQLPKSGKPRHVGLHPELAIVLRRWQKLCPETKEGLVFPVRDDGPRARWRMASAGHGLGLGSLLEFAGCHAPADGKPWHMLRHTFASAFVMRGGSLYALQQLLGHATPIMTQRYAHLAPSFLAAEVARLSFAPPAPAGVEDLGEERRRRASKGAV